MCVGTNPAPARRGAPRRCRAQLTQRSARAHLINHFRMQHPHIVGFKRAVRTETHLCIVTELMGQSLTKYVNQEIALHKHVPEAAARIAIAQTVCALAHCHALGVAHLDVKVRAPAARARRTCAALACLGMPLRAKGPYR